MKSIKNSFFRDIMLQMSFFTSFRKCNQKSLEPEYKIFHCRKENSFFF